MRIGSLRYLIKQGWHSMAANRLMTFASIGVLTACLIITGIATLLSLNINRIVDYFGQQNEIRAYILSDIPAEQIAGMQDEITLMPNVLAVEYVSQTDALAQMQGWMEEYGDLIAGYEDVLPASFRVTVDDLNFLPQVNERLRTMQGIESTSAPSELAGIMVTIKNAVTYGGWSLVVVLAVVSIIVISNTIRLTVFARRREISIMKYVGATNAFIRLPFFVEGMTVGIVAGALAAGVVSGAYHLIYGYLNNGDNLWIASLISQLLLLQDIWYWVLASFILFGVLIGGFGTASSIRKHLKV